VKPQPSDIVWEIGCGVPVLGFSFAYKVNSGNVLMTDLHSVIKLIKEITSGDILN
jgi:hypothetical protein